MCGGSFATFVFKMALDCKWNRRGRCLLCNECQAFTPWGKNIRCAYCDCPPTKHENLSIHETTTSGDEISSQTFAGGTVDQQQQSENKLTEFEEGTQHQFHGAIEVDNTEGMPTFSRGTLQSGVTSHESSANRVEMPNTDVKREDNFNKVPARNRTLTCPICKKRFKKVLNLKNHIILHKGRQKFKCGVCQSLFAELDQLVKHKRSHYQAQSNGSVACVSSGERQKQNIQGSKSKQAKRRKTMPKMTAIAPKQQTSLPSYQPGINLWGSTNQGAFMMSPLPTGLFSQVSVPPAQLIQTNTLNQMGRGVQPLYQQTPQQLYNQNENNMNQKLHNLLQVIDAKMSVLPQIDRKLDFIIHSLNMPRQQSIETPNMSIESDQVARSFEQIAAQIDDTNTRLLTTPDALPDKLNLKRGSLSPGEPIPDNILDEIYRASVSRRNLAKNLVFFVFTPEELRGRNCSGKVYGKGLPKEKLNQQKLHTVKMATFKKYPCEPGEMDLIWQRECIKAIDKAIRSRALSNKL